MHVCMYVSRAASRSHSQTQNPLAQGYDVMEEQDAKVARDAAPKARKGQAKGKGKAAIKKKAAQVSSTRTTKPKRPGARSETRRPSLWGGVCQGESEI